MPTVDPGFHQAEMTRLSNEQVTQQDAFNLEVAKLKSKISKLKADRDGTNDRLTFIC